ncbi:MAG TPA: MoaD/ThiS family protein [Candidatus Dormibacteraeota bacterium]
MSASLHLPAALRPSAGGEAVLPLSAPTLGVALDELGTTHPQLARRIRDEQGRVRRHIRIYVEDTDIAQLGGLETRLDRGVRVYVIPAVSGG